MNSAVVILACALGLAAATPIHQIVGLAAIHDDGSWKPHLDGSVLGSGNIHWLGADLDDGQYRPHLDGSYAGLVHHLYRRSLINANALPVPADTLHVALAKQAQLIQQNTEGTRNILGGGIPLHLPADTPEVAIGKQAHAIAHESQKALTHSGLHYSAAAVHAPLAYSAVHAPLAYSAVHAPLAHSAIHAPLAHSAIHAPLAYSGIHAPLAYSGIHGIHGLW